MKKQNNIDDLTPSQTQELDLLNYCSNLMNDHGVLYDVEELLFHPLSKRIFKEIKKGANPLDDLTLPDNFLSGYVVELRAKTIRGTLEDLKARREAYNENLKKLENVFNEDIDFTLKSDVRTIHDLVNSSLEQIINNPRGMHPLKWNDFYSTIGGFLAGEWIGIAGGSGDGKTTFAVDLIYSLQKRYKCSSAVISCEMHENALGKKLIKRINKLNTQEYIKAAHTDKDSIKDPKKYADWEKCQFIFDIYTLEGVVSFVKKYRPKFWALDYMGMLKRDHRFSSGDWAVELSNSMKALCKETGTIGIGLYQLDKTSQVNGKDGKRRIPNLADIYGGIGNKQAMDTGAVVYRKGLDHFVYWDKIRDEYNPRYKGVHFKALGNSGTGEIHTLEPEESQFRLDKTN